MVPRHNRSAYTVVEVLVVIAIIGVVVGLALPAVQRVREAGSRATCINNLHQLGLGLHNYHLAYKNLPPGVSYKGASDPYPWMGWETRLLPFLEQAQLWKQAQQAFAQTADMHQHPPHPSNVVLPLFACPSDWRTLDLSPYQTAYTSYVGVEGTNQFTHDGVLFLNSQVRFADISDGLSNTLMVGERPPSADGRLGWWYAGWGQNQDGSAEMLLGAQELCYGSWSGACPLGPYQYGPGDVRNQCDAFHFWSLHPGGANFLFADGSVHFLPYSAAGTLPALATRAGQEVLDNGDW